MAAVRIASLRTRLLAAVVDAAFVGVGMAAVVAMSIAGASVYRRFRDAPDDDAEKPAASKPGRQGFPGPRPAAATVRAAMAVLGIAGRNWRSPAFRIFGLRRVDARTGGPVSFRSAAAGLLLDQVLQRIVGASSRARMRRLENLGRALESQREEVERMHPDDPQARRRALQELCRENGVALSGCVATLPDSGTVSLMVLEWAAPGGRTVRDRVTGTAVVLDR